jgi:hypothetical protein
VALVRHVDFDKIVGDPRLNPSGRKLSRLEATKAHAELTRGKAMTDILESEAKVKIVEAMDTLRESGDYVEYSSGERYEVIEGAISSAEEVGPGQIRMFYFLPQDFPEMHAKKREKEEVAGVALRKISAIVRGPE